ncbi:FYN-binding protein 1-like [Callorhinchus milii]|nr:FYN-binding protein 1-like [Callorhinchus milii]
MAKFGSKPPGEEVASAVGPRMLRPIPHSSLQAVKTSVASRAAGFESTATPKPSGLKPTLSFSEHSGSAGPKPNPPWVSFPKPGTTARTQTEGLTPQKEAKPSFVKPGVGTKSLVSAFSVQAGEEKPVIPKPLVGLKAVTETRDLQKENESRFTKPPPFAKPLNPGNSYEKPAFPKPSGLKPSLGDRSTFPKPGPKPGAESVAGHKDSVEKAANEDGAVGRFPLRPVKQISGQGLKPTTFLQKPKAEEHSTAPPSIRPKPKGQFLAKRQSMEDSEEGKGLDTPKRKPLPATWTLGPPPQKPSRPPSINLDKFKQQQDRQPAIPPAFNKLANKQPPAPAPAGPSLPPRPQPGKAPDNTLPMDEEDQNYDDVSPAGPLPPPLPPLKLEDRQKRSNSPEENEDSGGEMYEDLDSYRSRKDIKEMEKKREKDDRKRQEQERREQREKEKKEQDIRKRFKVVGAIEVFQMVKASVDYKGGKNDLSFKQGENLEVIRITDNPEGRWLARTMDGCCKYLDAPLYRLFILGEMTVSALEEEGLRV